jgi:hypothetical protein
LAAGGLSSLRAERSHPVIYLLPDGFLLRTSQFAMTNGLLSRRPHRGARQRKEKINAAVFSFFCIFTPANKTLNLTVDAP